MTAVQDCITCRFWRNADADELRLKGAIVFTAEDDDGGGLGLCQRRAPIATGGMMSNPSTIWPVTGEAEGCGEHERWPGEHFEGGLRVTTYACDACDDGTRCPPGIGYEEDCPTCGRNIPIPF